MEQTTETKQDEAGKPSVPAMENTYVITNLELVKKAPSIMGMMRQKNLDIFRAICYPKTLLDGHRLGWEKLHELNLQQYSDKLAGEYADNLEAFKTEIAMTRNTVELNDYEPGKMIIINVRQVPKVG